MISSMISSRISSVQESVQASESASEPAPTQVSSSFSSSKSLPPTQKESLAFDVQEIPRLQPFRNQRTAFRCIQKRGLETASSLISSPPQPKPQPQSKEAKLNQKSISRGAIPLQQQQQQKEQRQFCSIDSLCTRTNITAAACAPPPPPPTEQLHGKKMASEKQLGAQITKHTSNKRLKRKLSEAGEEITNEGNCTSHAKNTKNATNGTNATSKNSRVVGGRISSFSTVIKNCYAADEKRKSSGPVERRTKNNKVIY